MLAASRAAAAAEAAAAAQLNSWVTPRVGTLSARDRACDLMIAQMQGVRARNMRVARRRCAQASFATLGWGEAAQPPLLPECGNTVPTVFSKLVISRLNACTFP